jgi:hypothetical protein
MSNGFSDKEMIELVLKGQGQLQTQLAGLADQINAIMQKGCAHREGDLLRIQELEGWRNKGIGGIIGSLLAAVGALAVAILSGK